MTSQWLPLAPGEPVAVVALSGPVRPADLEAGLRVLRGWGHPVLEATNLHFRRGYLAGADDERIAGLTEVLEAGARCLIAARGGYGATRLLPKLPLARMAGDGVRLVGFSDLTAVINGLTAAGGAAQIHGPMVASGLARSENSSRLYRLLTTPVGCGPLFGFSRNSIVRGGHAVGRAVGGNLSVLTALIGTPWEPDFEGSVVFLEEVGEPLYRVDRMLTHLRSSARFRGVKALIGGSLRGCHPKGSRAAAWRRLLLEVAPSGAPVVTGLPFGHGVRNYAFPVGATVEVDTSARRVTWR